MEVVSCQIKPIYTFLDYVQGGTEINCTIAIDFTGTVITSFIIPGHFELLNLIFFSNLIGSFKWQSK